MTVTAQLLVERGNLTDSSQQWGTFAFLAMPSPGDRIAAEHDGQTHYLTVLCVHHAPVPVDGTVAEAALPAASIVAKWTGSA